MSRNNFPLFLVDRSKHEKHPFDFVICTDPDVGFIARVIEFTEENKFVKFLDEFHNKQDSDIAGTYLATRNGGIAMVVEEFFYDFEVNETTRRRIISMLKRGFKKFLYGELVRTPADDLGIDNQIKQQQLTVERAEANFSQLLERTHGNEEEARYQIDLSKSILKSLHKLKSAEFVLARFQN